MRRTLTAIGSAALLALAASGCASGPAPKPVPGAPTLLAGPYQPDIVREAQVAGVLELRGDCFVLRGDEIDSLIVWPHGTTLGADQKSVQVPGAGTIRVGDRLSGGGGYYDTDPEQCGDDIIDSTAAIDLLP